MPDPLERRDEEADALAFAADEAKRYLADSTRPRCLSPASNASAAGFPKTATARWSRSDELVAGSDVATRSSGPRFFHFVTGGTTPAALAADWLTSLLDQNAFSAVSSPLGAQLEDVAVRWLLDLFELPERLGRGAHDRRHDGELRRTCVRPPLVGAGARGRRRRARLRGPSNRARLLDAVPSCQCSQGARDAGPRARIAAGSSPPTSSERELAALDGAPAIVIANAGDVNTGDFDPIARIADLAEKHRRLASRRRRLRALRAADPRSQGARRGNRARGLGDRRRAQVVERPLRLRIRLRS